MPKTSLSEARVRALRPRESTYDIRDAKLGAFGVRVLPSGAKRFFIHTQHNRERVWNIVGDANTMPVWRIPGLVDRFGLCSPVLR